VERKAERQSLFTEEG